MTWKVVRFPNSVAGIQSAMSLQDAFANVMLAHLAPKEAAMFARSSSSRVDYECYFSPAAVDLFGATLAIVNALDSAAPPSGDTSLLVGDQDAWKLIQ